VREDISNMFQYSQGKTTTQGHKGIPEGHFEEEHGRKGFFGPVSHLIKPKPSTRWTEIEGSLRPHLYDLVKLPHEYGKFQRLAHNSSIKVSNLWMESSNGKVADWGWRNANGDTLYFVHKGSGVVLTEYGLLKFRPGTYINMPKSLVHTFYFESETQFLVIESFSSYFREPDRGMLGRNGFYDLGAVGIPSLEELHAFKTKMKGNITKVHIDRGQETSTFTYAECIYDTVGWKGDFFPFTLHIDDLMPINSHRVHLPPSVHTTFVANGFVVCTFLPRPLETDADALKVPFYHQNIDYDEILFYHDGDFFSRANLHAGMMTIHPAGFPHGPHPKAIDKVKTKTHTDEVAVMIDTTEALQLDPDFSKVEVSDYWASWMK
jgi:homogentisate 1,2-dioxygenase